MLKKNQAMNLYGDKTQVTLMIKDQQLISITEMHLLTLLLRSQHLLKKNQAMNLYGDKIQVTLMIKDLLLISLMEMLLLIQ